MRNLRLYLIIITFIVPTRSRYPTCSENQYEIFKKLVEKYSFGKEIEKFQVMRWHFSTFDWNKTKKCYAYASQKNEPSIKKILPQYMKELSRHRETVIDKYMMIEFCGLNYDYELKDGAGNTILYYDNQIYNEDGKLWPKSSVSSNLDVDPEHWPFFPFLKGPGNPLPRSSLGGRRFSFSQAIQKVNTETMFSQKVAGIDCRAFGPEDLRTTDITNYGNDKIFWVSFGSTDLTSDYDFSIDIDYPRIESKKILRVIKRQLTVIDNVAILWKKSTKLMSNFWNQRVILIDSKLTEVAEPSHSYREIELIADSNGYPEVKNTFFQIWNQDPSFPHDLTDEANIKTYLSFLAAIEFSICDSSSLLILDLLNSGKIKVVLLMKPADEQLLRRLTETLHSCGIFNVKSRVRHTYFEEQYKKMANWIINRRLNPTKEDSAYDRTDKTKFTILLEGEQKKYKDTITEYKNAICQECSRYNQREVESLGDCESWVYYSITSGCRVWANEASITYGSLKQNLGEKYIELNSVRLNCESLLENLSLLFAHIFEHFEHGSDITDTNISDKIKYLIRTYTAIYQLDRFFEYLHRQEKYGFTGLISEMELKKNTNFINMYRFFLELKGILESVKTQKLPQLNKKNAYFDTMRCYLLSVSSGTQSTDCYTEVHETYRKGMTDREVLDYKYERRFFYTMSLKKKKTYKKSALETFLKNIIQLYIDLMETISENLKKFYGASLVEDTEKKTGDSR